MGLVRAEHDVGGVEGQVVELAEGGEVVDPVCEEGGWVSWTGGRGGEGVCVPGETLEIQPIGRGITQALNGSLGRL